MNSIILTLRAFKFGILPDLEILYALLPLILIAEKFGGVCIISPLKVDKFSKIVNILDQSKKALNSLEKKFKKRKLQGEFFQVDLFNEVEHI